MPTPNQLLRGSRKRKRKTKKSAALKGCPQVRGTVVQTTVVKPKKPNSANRPIVRVRLTNGKTVWASVPGEGLMKNIQEHSLVLVRGGRRPDLPGVKYRVVPGGGRHIPGAIGHYDESRPDPKKPRRSQSRSHYGVSKR